MLICMLNPWVDSGTREIRAEVGNQDQNRNQEENTLEDGIIPGQQGLIRETPQPRIREDDLNKKCPCHNSSEPNARSGHHRKQGIASRMTILNASFG